MQTRMSLPLHPGYWLRSGGYFGVFPKRNKVVHPAMQKSILCKAAIHRPSWTTFKPLSR
jgi:hypothetical protein